MQAAAAAVDRDRAIRLLTDLVDIPSPTGQEAAIAQFIADYMRDAGFDEVVVDDDWNVLGTIQGHGEGPRLLFLTHTDSSAAGQMADPFAAHVRDGAEFGVSGPVLVGRGAVAPKGAITAFLEGVVAARAAGREHMKGTIQVACVTKDLAADHEGVRELDRAVGLAADYVIAGEPSDNQVVMGARGISHIEVTFHGQPTHWGRPTEGINPLYGLADLLHGVEQLDLPRHEVLGAATISPFAVSAESEAPRTPRLARARFDRRVLPGERPEEVTQPFRDLVAATTQARPGLSGEVRRLKGMFPFQAVADSPLKAAILAAGRAVAGRDLGTTFIPFGSNAGYTSHELNIPGVAFAPGRITDVGDREFVELDKVIEAARVVAATCARLLS
jgi:succinyl-diaminopimelate desuccinylase